LYGLRKAPETRAEADAIAQRHGSRKSGLPPSGRKPSTKRLVEPTSGQQLELFD
jgi:deoxyribodipyrimidine photo-lyase